MNVALITHNLLWEQLKSFILWKDTSPCKIKQLKETWKTIEKQLNDLKEGKRVTFEELLLKLKVTENDYRLAVRSSLNAQIEKKTKWVKNK